MRRNLLIAPAALLLTFAVDVARALPMCVPAEAIENSASGMSSEAPAASTSAAWERGKSRPVRAVLAVDGSRGMGGYKRQPAPRK